MAMAAAMAVFFPDHRGGVTAGALDAGVSSAGVEGAANEKPAGASYGEPGAVEPGPSGDAGRGTSVMGWDSFGRRVDLP